MKWFRCCLFGFRRSTECGGRSDYTDVTLAYNVSQRDYTDVTMAYKEEDWVWRPGETTLMLPLPIRRKTECGCHRDFTGVTLAYIEEDWVWRPEGLHWCHPGLQEDRLSVEARETTLMSLWPTRKRTECGGRRDYDDVILAYKKEDWLLRLEGLHWFDPGLQRGGLIANACETTPMSPWHTRKRTECEGQWDQSITGSRFPKNFKDAEDKYLRAKGQEMASKLPGSSRSHEQWLLNFPVLPNPMRNNFWTSKNFSTCLWSKPNSCRRCKHL